MKKNIIPFIFLLFTISLIIFSSYNISAARTGLTLWATSVVPSLFPFFIATELLSKTNITKILGKHLSFIMKPLFNIRGEGSFALIMGIISGYPVGAKIVCDYRENNILTKEECERLLSFTNNSGPLFIIGTIGAGMYGSSKIGLLLLITHILSSITVGIIFRFWKKSSNNKQLSLTQSSNLNTSKTILLSNLGEIIAESLSSATTTIMMIGGFVVLFSVIISILKASHIFSLAYTLLTPTFNILHITPNYIIPILTGILEITNGISLISNVSLSSSFTSITITSFLLGFGGISVFLQVWSIVSKTDLSIKPYILGKLLHGFIAAIYTLILFIQ